MKWALLLLASCAVSSGEWKRAEEACDEERENAHACHELTSAIETTLTDEWISVATTYPNYGEVVLALVVDEKGQLTDISTISSKGDPGLPGEAMRTVRRIPQSYARVAGRRLFLRFDMRPAEVRVLMPPRGNVALVRGALLARREAYFACYTAGAAWEKTPLEGTLHVKIGKDGLVKEAHLDVTQAIDQEVIDCIVNEAKKIEMEAWKHEGQEASLPISFKVRQK
jgi:TonB family protein